GGGRASPCSPCRSATSAPPGACPIVSTRTERRSAIRTTWPRSIEPLPFRTGGNGSKQVEVAVGRILSRVELRRAHPLDVPVDPLDVHALRVTRVGPSPAVRVRLTRRQEILAGSAALAAGRAGDRVRQQP